MPFQSEKQRRYLHANHPEIAKRWERDYANGGISNLFKPRTGFHRGSLRHQKEHDYQAYEDEGNFMKYLLLSGDRAKSGPSPEGGVGPYSWLSTDTDERMGYDQWRDDFETMQKERFMYGEHVRPNVFKKIWSDVKGLLKKKDKKKDKKKEEKKEEKKEYANGGISNHFRKKFDAGSEDSYQQLLDDWDAGFIKDALPGEDFTTYYNRIMKVENDTGTEDVELLNLLSENQDPLNLSQGVTTLFQAKDGGRIGFFTGAQADTAEGKSMSPGTSASGGTRSGGDGGYQSVHDTGAVSETPGRTTTTKSSTGDGPGNIHGGPTVKEALRIGALKKSAIDFEKEKGGPDFYGIRQTQEIVKNARDQWDKVKNSTNEKLKKKVGSKIVSQLFLGGATFGIKDIIDVMVAGYKQGKAKNEFIEVLNESIETYQDLGIPEHSPHTDTLIQKLNQEILDLTQTRKKPDEDTGGDGPLPPISIPEVTETLAKATDEGEIDMFDAWGEIKRKQALNASLQAKWAAEQEARDQSFMVANSGGLANLFRVKKQ